ncbi:MAG: UDP-N-acetylmuramate dehydrogenase [Victivallaceae bacterium]|nr:UDP-N-acetylmuramate dehydrogenase [Victivallaceae bacterium]
MAQWSLAPELLQAVENLPLKIEVPFRELTTLGVGGVVPVLAEPVDDMMLSQLLAFTSKAGVPVFPLGGGSNLLGSDRNYSGVVIRLVGGKFSQLSFDDNSGRVTVGAGVRLGELINRALEHGLGGLAGLAGIPGSVGGAARMNAGASGVEIGSFVREIAGCMPDGSMISLSGNSIEWGYRKSSLPRELIVTGLVLELKKVNPEEEKSAIRAELERRRNVEPKGRTAGCMFKNVGDSEPVGRLIERAGLKGFSIGGAMVSHEHGNYIVNTADATEKDVVDLMRHIRRQIVKLYGFYLESEVVFFDPQSKENVLTSPKPPSVLVLKGGTSSEREISLRSGAAVANALRNGGYQVDELDITECAATVEMKNYDVVYPVLHGGFGEDGRIQKELEEAKITFVGGGSTSCEKVMDKIVTKKILDECNLPTAKWAVVSDKSRAFPSELHFPVVIKAPREGSTIGIVKVDTIDDWDAAVEAELKYDRRLLVEEFIEGTELTIPVMLGRALPAIEIKSPHGFYDYDAKYVYRNGKTEYFCPVRTVSSNVIRQASQEAIEFYHRFNCRDIVRVDYIVDRNGTAFILEGNSIPGCTATSLVPKAAKVAGISFESLTAQMVQTALLRKRGGKGSPSRKMMVKLLRWAYRLFLLLLALPIFFLGSTLLQNAMEHQVSWQVMTLAGGLLFVALLTVAGNEVVFRFLDRLDQD